MLCGSCPKKDESTSFLKWVLKKIFENIPLLISFGILLTLLGIYGVVYLIDASLPSPLYLTDESKNLDAFITERVRQDLKVLTDIGPRVVGTRENEVLAVEFLTERINAAIEEANEDQKIELDIQLVSGSFDQYSYSNVQNVIVKLHGANASQSVLINSHFDSVKNSPGGSDDGINVVVMLEILRKISKESKRPRNNLIFLFNGAEETHAVASHGFITQHKWAEECKVVLNLEANGAGGKIILFQTGPAAPWLMDYYSKVPHPYGQVAAEEIFQSSILPFYTDFKRFVDFGGLVGFDMAFFKNGFRYHTKDDGFENIPLGSFQHVGDNALSLVRSLANAPEAQNPKKDSGKIVYFDFLGGFMISYSETIGHVINSLVLVFSLAVMALFIYFFKLQLTKENFKNLALVLGAIVVSWFISICFAGVLAPFIVGVGRARSWYKNAWIIFGLYTGPSIALSTYFVHSVIIHSVSRYT